jgi:hypothetical protein
MVRRAARAASWFAALLGLLLALRLAATGDLAPPPLASPDDLGSWADARSPVASAVALVRLSAELAVWYLLGLSVLHAVAARRPGGGSGVVARLAPVGALRLVRAGLGLGLVASVTVQPSGALAASVPPGTATMQPLPEEGSSGTARMVPQAPTATLATPAPLRPPAQHRVEAGESFWTIATDVLGQAWGRPATDAEVDPFWRALVDANRDRLVSDDPDLVLPGQVFEVPPPPAAPT